MRRLAKLGAAAFTVAAVQPLSAAEPVAGNWMTADKPALVEIAPCGKALCGTIVKFLGPQRGTADPRDVNNTNPALRSRRILRMAILTGFTPDGNKWNGQIYDPRSGTTYRSVLVRKGNQLDVKGCISVFCKTQVWTKG